MLFFCLNNASEITSLIVNANFRPNLFSNLSIFNLFLPKNNSIFLLYGTSDKSCVPCAFSKPSNISLASCNGFLEPLSISIKPLTVAWNVPSGMFSIDPQNWHCDLLLMKVAEAPGAIAMPEEKIRPHFLHCIKRFGMYKKFLLFDGN